MKYWNKTLQINVFHLWWKKKGGQYHEWSDRKRTADRRGIPDEKQSSDETPEYDCTKWDDIRVPAHIQMEGYDAPQYANVQYPWEGREEIQPGEIPERFNPTASYVKYFEVPDQMKGKRLFVSFQGAESGIAVWLKLAMFGYSEDTFDSLSSLNWPRIWKRAKINWLRRFSNGRAEAGARIRISSVSPVFTVMCICTRFRRFTFRI